MLALKQAFVVDPIYVDLARLFQNQLRLRLRMGSTGRFLPEVPERKGDTLFILGTGTSTNRFRASWWDSISKSYSIGINEWLIHRFVPDWYIVEPPSDWNRLHAARHNLGYRTANPSNRISLKDNGFGTTGTLFRRQDRLPSNVNVILPYYPRLTTKKSVFNWLFSNAKCWRHPWFTEFVGCGFQIRASITFAISVGIIYRFKNVVLCGVDLFDGGHFFESSRDYVDENCLVPKIVKDLSQSHPTANSALNPLTIVDVLSEMDGILAEEYGIKLWTAFSGSGTARLLPTFFD